MRILALEQEMTNRAYQNLGDLYRAEAAAAWDLQQRGIIRDLWFTSDRRAVLMLECANATEARQQLGTLPLVQAGLVEFTVIELRSYDGFERLFARAAETAAQPAPEEPAEY